MIKRHIAASYLLSFTCLLLISFTDKQPVPNPKQPRVQQKQPLKRIIIDAGHGGTDVGAKGRYSTEKDLCLSIALRLEKMMQQEIPDVELFMTRTTDVYDDVVRKAEIANQAKGDLFLCIHVNSARPIKQTEFIGYKTVTAYKGKGKKEKSTPRKLKTTEPGISPILPKALKPLFTT